MNDLEIREEIIRLASASLSADYPFFAFAVGAAAPSPCDEEYLCSTDGKKIFFGKPLLTVAAAEGAGKILLGEIHCLLHDLFGHPFKVVSSAFKDVADDVTVGYYVDSLGVCFGDRRAAAFRKKIYERIIESRGGITEELCSAFLSEQTEDQIDEISAAFKVCDHRSWQSNEKANGTGGDSENGEDDQKRWIEIARRIIPLWGSGLRELRRKIENVVGSDKDYRSFLRRFLKTSERKKTSDEFDYGYYCYGLNLYGNVPLIENLESSEDKDYSQIVVAIDVSGSVKGEPVKKFVEEVYAICEQISERDKLKLRIIQCDNQIRADEIVDEEDGLKQLSNSFELIGGGGTDFRPVFKLLDADAKRGAKIRALLYFTDGRGEFPSDNPEYKTCFLLYGEGAEEIKTPYFAYKIIIDEN